MTQAGTTVTAIGGATRWAGRLLLLAISLSSSLLLIEIGLRMGGYSPSFVNPMSAFNVRDPILGHRGAPNLARRFQQRDFDIAVAHDAGGFRKPAQTPSLPDTAPRLLVFGDSYTWGWGVESGSVFTDLLAERLPAFVVRNLGISGVGTVVEYRLFETGVFADRLRAGDVVVVMFYRNDFEDNVAGRLSARLQDGRVVLNAVDVTRDARLYWLRQHVFAFNLVSYNLERFFKLRRQSQLARIGVDSAASRVAEHYLSQFRARCEAARARMLVVEIPDRALYGEGFIDQAILDHGTVTHSALLSLTQRLGIDTLDLLPVLRDALREHPDQPLTFTVDTHWTAHGHRVVAGAMAARIGGESLDDAHK